MRKKLFNTRLLLPILFLLILITISCKKDKLEVNEVKTYDEADHIPSNPYDGGWRLTLNPNGDAAIAPGGDVIYSARYTVSGSKIKVKTQQDSRSYTFLIVSETEIRERGTGTVLIKKLQE